MSYLKRISSPRTWITKRKGTKYLTSPYPGKLSDLSMPLNLVIRDLLKIVDLRKEVKIMLHQKEILVDGKLVNTEKFPVGIFEIVSLPKIKKNYQIFINEKKRFDAREVKDSEIDSKSCKVIGKTSIGKGKIQLNLFNGRNVLSEDKNIKVNDSVIIDLKSGKLKDHLPIKAGSKVYIVGGTHLGSNGVVEKVSEHKVNVKLGDSSFELQMKNVYVVK